MHTENNNLDVRQHTLETASEAQSALASTLSLQSISLDDFDAIFYPGGHGPLWDLAEDGNSINLLASALASNKPLALVCHAPGVLSHVKNPDGTPVVKGKKVTGFKNSEEAAVGLSEIVPFLVEDELISRGGQYSSASDWVSYVVKDVI